MLFIGFSGPANELIGEKKSAVSLTFKHESHCVLNVSFDLHLFKLQVEAHKYKVAKTLMFNVIPSVM